MMESSGTGDRELHLEETLDAPVARVWEAWTQTGQIANWWGPQGFTNTISKMDVSPGGEWNLIMHGPDGTDYKNKSVFREVVPFERIIFEHLSGPKYLATISFEPEGNKTRISWRMLFETPEQFVQVVKVFKADEGLKQNILKLNEYLRHDKQAAL